MEQLKNESELLCTLEHPGIVKVLVLSFLLDYGIVLKF